MTDDITTLIAQYLDAAASRGVARSTLGHYATALKRFATFLGHRPINRATLRSYLRHLQADPRIRPTTVESYWSACGSFCTWLVDSGMMPQAPAIPASLGLPRRIPAGDEVSNRARSAAPGSPADLMEQFIDSRLAKGLSPKTVLVYRERCERFVAWLDSRPLTRQTIRKYILHLQQHEPALAPSTIAAYVRDVRTMCAFAVEEGLLDANPARGLVPRVPQKRIASYTKEQITQLLHACDLRDRAMIITLLDTGLRASELVSLARRDVDLVTGAFDVLGKGSKTRTCFLSPYTMGLIAEYLSTRADGGAALFVGRTGEPLTRNGLYQAIRRRSTQAGIRGEVRRLCHSMRASFAKNFSKRGGSLDTLADLLGHSTLSQSRHYAALNQEELGTRKATVNPLAAFIDDAA